MVGGNASSWIGTSESFCFFSLRSWFDTTATEKSNMYSPLPPSPPRKYVIGWKEEGLGVN